jgi:hypothetical protein
LGVLLDHHIWKNLSCRQWSSTFLQIFVGVLLIYKAVHPNIVEEKMKPELFMLPLGDKELTSHVE